ncbi:hypothetical protein [Alteribacter populi]|uniref:hypothetical protein n=1 Tax=Alteribacter populi TaxID=2011011 RepID=UPI000BBB07C2|nr:hypothetical protein [Alteribacter populi]
MKKKVISTAMAMTIVLGGATYSSAAFGSAPETEGSVPVIQEDYETGATPTMYSFITGPPSHQLIFHSGQSLELKAAIEYEKMKTAFDL